MFTAITGKTTQRWEGENIRQLITGNNSVCLKRGVRTQKGLISSCRSRPLGRHLNAASKDTFRRLLGVNTILDRCAAFHGSVIKTVSVTFDSRNGTSIVQSMSMAGCVQDTCFSVPPRCTRAHLSSWNTSTPCPSPCVHTLRNKLRFHLQVEECFDPLEKISHTT